MNQRRSGGRRAGYDAAYAIPERPPWEFDGPTPFVADLVEAGRIEGPVLDAGCGTGENALFLASLGFDVVGIDTASAALSIARGKACARAMNVRFVEADALSADAKLGSFGTVIDSGLFHTFVAEEQLRYSAALGRVLRVGGVLNLLAISDQNDPPVPAAESTWPFHEVSVTEIETAFSGPKWLVSSIVPLSFEIQVRGRPRRMSYWLASIRCATENV